MSELSRVLSLSTFSNYGKNLDLEIQAEVFIHILTQKKSVSYYRAMGIRNKENTPLTIQRALEIGIDITDSIQLYNDNITSDKYERQVSMPFDEIEFDDTGMAQGNLGVRALYYTLKDFKSKEVNV